MKDERRTLEGKREVKKTELADSVYACLWGACTMTYTNDRPIVNFSGKSDLVSLRLSFEAKFFVNDKLAQCLAYLAYYL